MREVQSNLILDLVQSAAKVEMEIETHAEEIAARLDDRFAPLCERWEEDREKPDFQATLWAFKDTLGDSREQLEQAEERHVKLLRKGIELREERQELTGGLYEDFSSMRRTVEELYRGKGKGNVNAFVVAGIQGPTAQKPTGLLRQVDLAVQHLLQPGLEFPASRFGETRLEPGKLAKVLVPRAERMHEVQTDLRRVGSELNGSRKEKSRALAAHKATFSWVASGAESLFHLAGEHELAERIRPSTRRPGRRAVEDKGDGEGESQAGANPEEGSVAEGSAEANSGQEASGDSPAGEALASASPAVASSSETAPSSASSDG